MKLFTFISLLAISLLSCSAQTADPEVLKSLAAKSTTAIIDVRTPEEFSGGHLDKAVNIPLPLLADSVDVLKKYENIIVVCKGGGRAAKGKTQLEANGFTNVYNGGGWTSLKTILEESAAASLLKEDKTQYPDSLIVLDYPQSMDALLAQFKGRVVYIDVMASWCKPCIVELKESKKMDSFFKENNIVKLYITRDENKDIRGCVNLLKRIGVSGYFVSYHPLDGKYTEFTKDLDKIYLSRRKNYGLPTYSIINKEGKVVVLIAERPSKSEALKEQLKKYMD